MELQRKMGAGEKLPFDTVSNCNTDVALLAKVDFCSESLRLSQHSWVFENCGGSALPVLLLLLLCVTFDKLGRTSCTCAVFTSYLGVFTSYYSYLRII